MLGGMLCRVAACSPAWTARALFDFSSHARKGDSRSEYRGGTQARDRRGPGGSAAPRACPGAACVGLSDSRGAVTTPQLGEDWWAGVDAVAGRGDKLRSGHRRDRAPGPEHGNPCTKRSVGVSTPPGMLSSVPTRGIESSVFTPCPFLPEWFLRLRKGVKSRYCGALTS